ncbi:Clp protease N-terminal domain-containing protein [Kribbella sancticallisti]|uniref:Clp protease N-terminal domain-containing protein n=1 Tax=Kribbella sancticallisti TaxID=460087 RepID=A0ABN2DN23_9ACTN
MFERFTDQAREVIVQAQAQARRLGHGYIGCEHLLLSVASTDSEAGKALRELGVTPEAVESAAVGILSGGQPVLDRDALAAFGIDLDAVQERVEAAFGPGALTRPVSPSGRRRGWRRRRCESGPPIGGIPFTPWAKKCLADALREMTVRHDAVVGVEHIALALTVMTEGMAPRIFSRLGVSTARARAEILDRYRAAG